MSASLLPMPGFEEMAQLAQERPADFEKLRAALVEDFIAHAPRRLEKRLRGLQFRIDGVRRLSKSDYGAAQRVFLMMWESFESLASLWRQLPGDLRYGLSTPQQPSAVILRLDVAKPSVSATTRPGEPLRS